MPDNQGTKLAGRVITLYRRHCGLFWRIVMPVAIIAIILDIAMFFYSIPQFGKNIKERGDQNVEVVTANVNTISGIHPTAKSAVMDTRSSSGVSWQFYLIPNFHSTDDRGVTWKWELNFRSLEYNLFILLLLTFCPLSLAVARILRRSEVSDIAEGSVPPTACEMWRRTGRKALKIFVAFLLFVLNYGCSC